MKTLKQKVGNYFTTEYCGHTESESHTEAKYQQEIMQMKQLLLPLEIFYSVNLKNSARVLIILTGWKYTFISWIDNIH